MIKMEVSKLVIALLSLQALFFMPIEAAQRGSNLYREYIGAMFKNVKFTDVPVNPNVDFHFILSFAIDYTNSASPSPTNGRFNIFWDTNNLGPSQVASIKAQHPNVKVALSLGGATVYDKNAMFNASSITSWVSNAVSSLTSIIKEYHLDGIDIDYETFVVSDPTTFTECIGQLVLTLKANKVIKFASIAPFENSDVQSHYLALWRKYGHLIDYVNFQFYSYDKGTTVDQFIDHFNNQSSNYRGGNVLVSFISDESGGLTPDNGFFKACNRLKSQNKLFGIFAWCADDSKANDFRFEKQSQALLAG